MLANTAQLTWAHSYSGGRDKREERHENQARPPALAAIVAGLGTCGHHSFLYRSTVELDAEGWRQTQSIDLEGGGGGAGTWSAYE
jgi:hypothetical protein